MAFARVVSFEGVSKERIAQIQQEIDQDPQPDEVPATEILMLHDPEAESSLVVVLFDTEDDYARGDEILSAMPADETPGRRTSVRKYEVAFRRSR